MVTLKVHEEFPHTFAALHVTVVVPVAKEDPDEGTHTTGAAGVPLAEGSLHDAIWLSHCTIFPGHAPTTGDVLMVTLKEQLTAPLMFDTLQFTGVVPGTKVEPEAGEQSTLGEGLPVEPGVYVATRLSHCVISAGQVMVGDTFVSPASNSPKDVSEVTLLLVDVIVPAVVVSQTVGRYFLTTYEDVEPVASAAAKLNVASVELNPSPPDDASVQYLFARADGLMPDEFGIGLFSFGFIPEEESAVMKPAVFTSRLLRITGA